MLQPSSIIKTCLILLIPASLLLGACKEKKVEDFQGAAITALKGKIEVTNNKGETGPISAADLYTKKALLLTGFTIRTSAASSVDLAMGAGTVVRIGPSTEVSLGSTRIVEKSNFTQVQLNLKTGRLYTKTGKLSKGSHFNIVTPTSIASVRGTEFLVKEEGGKSSTLVKTGAVEVADADMKNLEPVAAGKKAEVSGKDVKVNDLTDDDKKELNDMGSDIASISETGKQQMQEIMKTFEEQKILIKQALEEQKRSNENLIEGQKEKNKDLITEQRERDLQMIRDQIARDKANVKRIKDESQKTRDEIKDKTKAAGDKIKSGGKGDMNRIKKKTPGTSQDKTKSELEKLKKLQ